MRRFSYIFAKSYMVRIKVKPFLILQLRRLFKMLFPSHSFLKNTSVYFQGPISKLHIIVIPQKLWIETSGQEDRW